MQGIKNLTHGPINRQLFNLAMPIMATSFIQMAYSLTDMAWVGRLGSEAVAAIGSVGILTWMSGSISLLNKVGSEVSVGQSIGAQNQEDARHFASHNITIALIISLCWGGLLFILAEPIICIYELEVHITANAIEYLRIISTGMPFIFLSAAFTGIYNAAGRSKIPFYISGAGLLLNIILDPIFIFWFDMGVKGAALATVLSQACSAAWVLSFLFSRRASLSLEKRNMRLSRKIVFAMLALGISPFIMASTESLVGFVLNSSLKNFGDIYVSALTILQSAMQFASVPLTGFALGFVPIISYNYGHGDKQRVKDCFRIVMITMFSFNLLLMLLMILFPTIVASAFTSDEKLIETVRWTMPVFLGGMTIFGLQRACQNMFVALGQAKISIFIALLRKAILLIPLALILPHYMGVTGVYAAEAISDATAAICCTLLFFWQFPKILGKIQGNILRTD